MTADQERGLPQMLVEYLRSSAYVISGDPRPRLFMKPVPGTFWQKVPGTLRADPVR